MRVLAAMTTLVVASLAMPAWPQQVPPEDQRTTLQQQVEQRERQERERRDDAAAVEKAYQRQIRSSGPTPKTDPWGNIRDSTPSKSTK